MSHDQLPIVVGVGNSTHRPEGLESTASPAQVLASAAHAALNDCALRASSVDVVMAANVSSWRYTDAAAAVADLLGVSPRATRNELAGGEGPTRLLLDAAEMVADGAADVVLVVGGEAARSRTLYNRQRVLPPWPAQPTKPARRNNGLSDQARAHGLVAPTQVYALFEVARRAKLDRRPLDGHARSASIQAGLSAVAAETDGAWIRERVTADTIARVDENNRWISWPYTKLMCANPVVDQAGAAVVTTVGKARLLGLDLRKAVYVCGGVSAEEPWDIFDRPDLGNAPALESALQHTLDLNRIQANDIAALELYSCFPVVPWTAADALDLPVGHSATTVGGLTFFGGPTSSYMACATTGAVNKLRTNGGGHALLYGNGLFMTKHQTAVLSSEPPLGDRSRRGVIDAAQRDAPAWDPAPSGPAVIETCTVSADQSGRWTSATVVGRTQRGSRFIANTPADPDTFAALTDMSRHPVGVAGDVTPNQQSGLNTFTMIGDSL